MIKTKLATWIEGSIGRAQKAFQRKSGWTSRQLESTLKSISGLKAVDQVLLGGLVVGKAVMKKEKSPRVSRVKPARRRSGRASV